MQYGKKYLELGFAVAPCSEEPPRLTNSLKRCNATFNTC